MLRRPLLYILIFCLSGLPFTGIRAQTDSSDYYLGHGFSSGDTVYTNSGTFWDAGGLANYSTGENWYVYFCATNGNPITVDFEGFATYYDGTPPATDNDYMSINYSGIPGYIAYHDDTPEFSFTSQNGCIRFGFISQLASPTHNGWEAEIYAIPPPVNHEPCGAVDLNVGNVCSPQVFSNKGAYPTTGFGNTPCHNFFGGDVWFTATVPTSGQLKIESSPGSLEWAVMALYTGTCGSLSYLTCIEDSLGMPIAQLTGRTPGETIYIRMYGDQAKSGTFGMCASDPAADIEGYTGPGGVGDDSTNVLWLKADMGVLNNSDADASNGEAVKMWEDQSGNDNDVKQYTGSAQPILTTGIINGMPVLTLDGTDDYMYDSLGTLAAPMTLITVNRFTDPGQDDYLITIGNDLGNVKTVSISREDDDNYYAFTDGGEQYGPALNDNTPYLIQTEHNIASTYHGLYIDADTYAPADYGTPVATNGSFFLGSSKYTGNFLGGDVAEVIIYNQILNSAQKIIVENSLAAKYGISIPTDRYAFEGTYKYDVAGIGQIDASNRHTEAQSARTLAIGNATDLDDGEFVLFGHDNGDITAWTSAERPNNDANVQRIAREWRLDTTGGHPGSLTVTLSDSILPAMPGGFNTYNLWLDSDGIFSADATPVPLVKVNDEYVANAVDLADGVYITVGVVTPVVNFSLTSSSELESVTSPTVEVSMNYAMNEEISVDFRAEDITAAGDSVDYLLSAGSATFAAGDNTTDIEPRLVNDTIVELPDETFKIILKTPDPGLSLGDDTIHTFTILNNDIEVTASTDNDTIGACGATQANLSTMVTGTGPYIYAWTPTDSLSDPAISNPVADPSASTWYKVTVTDQTNGAIGVDSVLITVISGPAKPTITPAGSTTFCDGDSVLLSSSPGDTYLWSTGETTKDIYAKIDGAYTVRVYDEFGCESEVSDAEPVTVNSLPAKPAITPAGTVTFCDGDSVDLASDAGSTYIWSTGATTQTIRVKTAGKYAVQVTNAAGCASPTSDSTEVIVNSLPAKPSVTPDGPTAFCDGDSVDLTSDAGSTYIWSTGETTQTIRVKTAGKFAVQVTNAAGCTSPASDSTEVIVNSIPAKPSITPAGTVTFCDGDSVDMTSDAGSTYIWSTGATTQTIRAKTAGKYAVQVTNAAGCASPTSDSTEVIVNSIPARPSITPAGTVTFCDGDSVDLTSDAGSSYIWSTGETTQTIRVKTAGKYAVQVTNAAGCASPASDSTEVIVNSLPAKPAITPAGTVTFCDGDSVDLTSDAGSSYIWSNGATTQTIRVKTAGKYAVQVTNAAGCASPASDSTEAIVNSLPAKPAITPAGTVTFCDGDSVDLTSDAGSTYIWSTGATTQTIRAKTAGKYALQVTNAAGCASPASDSTEVIVNSLPARPSITPSGTVTFCEGDSVDLTSDAGSTYIWSNGATTQTIRVKTVGKYAVQVTNASGCLSATSDSTEVIVNSIPAKPSVTPAGTVTFCEGDSVDLTSDAGSTYIWSNGATTQTIRVKTAGKYAVQVTNAAGCASPASDSTEVTVNILPAQPVISGESEYCTGDSAQLSAPAADSYLWSNGAATSIIYVQTGSYTLMITDANGCDSPSSLPFTVSENSLPPKPSISGNASYCEGNMTDLISSAANAYLWSTGATTGTITATAGQYWLSVSDLNGCTSENSDTISITELPKPAKPVITAGGPIDFWLGDSVMLSASPATSYLWSPGGETSQEIAAKDSGDYQVTIADINGCMSDQSDILLVVVRSLAQPTITVTGLTEFCEGEPNPTLSSSSGNTYLWSNGATTRDIEVNQSGTYTVQIFDVSGHPSAHSDPVVVSIHTAPEIGLLSSANILCNGGSTGTADLIATGGMAPYTYTWNSGHTGAQEANLPAGDYRVILSDDNLCADTLEFSLSEPEAIEIEETLSPPYCSDAEDGSVSVLVSGGTPAYILLWSDGTNENSLANLPPGSVSLTVTDANNCQEMETYDLLPANTFCILVPEIITPNNDGFNDAWIIQGLEYYTGVTVEVFDRWGKRIFFSQGYDTPWEGTYNGKELPMSSYHFVIRINNGSPPMKGNITIVR